MGVQVVPDGAVPVPGPPVMAGFSHSELFREFRTHSQDGGRVGGVLPVLTGTDNN